MRGDGTGVSEERTGVGPFFEPRETRRGHDHACGNLPHAHDGEEVRRVAEVNHDEIIDHWMRCRSQAPPIHISQSIVAVKNQYRTLRARPVKIDRGWRTASAQPRVVISPSSINAPTWVTFAARRRSSR